MTQKVEEKKFVKKINFDEDFENFEIFDKKNRCDTALTEASEVKSKNVVGAQKWSQSLVGTSLRLLTTRIRS